MPGIQLVTQRFDAKKICPMLRAVFKDRLRAVGLDNCVEVQTTETRMGHLTSDYAIVLIGEPEDVKTAHQRIETIIQTENR